MFLSTGVENGKVGVDAAFYFAWPEGSSLCKDPKNEPEIKHSMLEFYFDDAKGWDSTLRPSGYYDSDHIYEYHLVGQGVPLQVRFTDSPHDDNYGQFKIEVLAG